MTEMVQIPLFPLSTVLFSGSVLSLRIFEPRYLSMVGRCMRNGSGFGVVLITEGAEAGRSCRFHEVGTIARIEDFDQLDDGYLGITCRGESRFRVIDHEVQEDRLITATVKMLAEQVSPPLPQRYSAMRSLLQKIYQQVEFKVWADTITPDWDNGHWLACRLIDVLPLTAEGQQVLLEMEVEDRLRSLALLMNEADLI